MMLFCGDRRSSEAHSEKAHKSNALRRGAGMLAAIPQKALVCSAAVFEEVHPESTTVMVSTPSGQHVALQQRRGELTMTRACVLLSSRNAAPVCSGGVLRPHQVRQQLRRSQVRVLFDLFKHCGETRKNAVWWPAFNDVSEGAGDAHGDQLFERRQPRKCHVCCEPAELLRKKTKRAGTASEI